MTCLSRRQELYQDKYPDSEEFEAVALFSMKNGGTASVMNDPLWEQMKRKGCKCFFLSGKKTRNCYWKPRQKEIEGGKWRGQDLPYCLITGEKAFQWNGICDNDQSQATAKTRFIQVSSAMILMANLKAIMLRYPKAEALLPTALNKLYG